MQRLFEQLRQRLNKPLLFGLYGAAGCLIAATLLGEAYLALTKMFYIPVQSPQAIVILIDCSGSMDGDKIREVKSAAQSFVQRQDLSKNSIAVVGFGSNIHVGATLNSKRNALDHAITQLSDGGGTKMDIAIEAATRELQDTDIQRNILLFTDGKPGYRGADFEYEKVKTLEAGKSARNQKIKIVAVATGDADISFLSQLTDDSSFVFYVRKGEFDQAFRQAEKAIFANQLVESRNTGKYRLTYSIFRIGGWTALLAVGMSLALLMGQNHYMRRRILTPNEGIINVFGSIISGFAAGGLGQLIYTPVAGIPILAIIGRIIGWTSLGALLAGGMSFFVPNLQPRRALIGGSIGGATGAIGFSLISILSGDTTGRLVGVIVIGFFIGLMIALIEQFSREAWLVVHWSPKEQNTISLGAKPVLLGSSNEAHIYLPKNQGYPSLAAKIFTEGKTIIIEYSKEMRKLEGVNTLRDKLKDGDQLKFGHLMIEIRTSK